MLITLEQPLDYAESSMLVITGVISDGGNPFDLENQPARTSVYPVLYNLIVTPATLFFKNSLQIHRLVAALFLAASCAICFLLHRKSLVPRIDSAVAASLLYAALLYYSTPVASPNGLGLFLFLTAIAIPYLCGFSKRTLAVSIGCGILAFYTKQYFIASLGYVALYILLALSKKQSILFGLYAAGTLLVSALFVHLTSPYYFDNTLFAVKAASSMIANYDYVLLQFKAYALIFYPLLAIPIIATLFEFFSNQRLEKSSLNTSPGQRKLNLSTFDKPLLTNAPDYMRFCLASSIVIIAVSLGTNPGNYLTYLMQLITPFLLVSVFSVANSTTKPRKIYKLLIILMMYNSYAALSTDISVNEKNWKKIKDYIDNADNVYASTLVLPEILMRSGNVYANGHTRYFPLGAEKPTSFIKADSAKTVSAIWEKHVKIVQQKLADQEYDLVLLDQWMQMPEPITGPDAVTRKLLQTHYECIETFTLSLPDRPGGGPYRIRAYKPRETMRSDCD